MSGQLTASKILKQKASGQDTATNREAFEPLEVKLKKDLRLVQTFQGKNSVLVAWFKFSSESVKAVKYDVVLMFTPTSSTRKLFDWKLSVYSNSPFFTYHLGYVCEKNNWIVDFLKTKLAKTIRKKQPDTRNPEGEFKSDKTIIASLLRLESLGFDNVSTFKQTNPIPLKIRDLAVRIASASEKLRERQSAKPLEVKPASNQSSRKSTKRSTPKTAKKSGMKSPFKSTSGQKAKFKSGFKSSFDKDK